MENVNKKISFYPLICSILGILSLLGSFVTIKTKVGDTSFSKDLFLWNLFDFTLTKPFLIVIIISTLVIAGILPLFGLKFAQAKEPLAVISLLLFIFSFCFIVTYPQIHSSFASNLIQNYKSTKISWGAGIAMLFSALGAIFALVSSGKEYGSSVKAMCEDGILVALAFVLNFIKIPLGPSGSINFQMIPLFIIALRRGPIHGFISGGIVFGILTCLTDGYGIATYPFDYLIGFGSVGVIGLFRNLINKTICFKSELFTFIACLLATCIRYIGSTVSSIVIYQYNFVPALQYNALYIPLTGLLATVVVMLLLPLIKRINRIYATAN